VPPRIALALAIHNHQPVGNFGWVIGQVFEQAYRPMLEAIERHGTVSLSIHYSGPLLDWLRREQPEFLARIGVLVRAGRVELLGGGYYEPALASLPERDRVGQLVRMADELERIAGVRPRGAWLAERVWEPDMPSALGRGGYHWTILDDAHFRAAAIPEANLWGAYTTDDQGHLLTVFGTEQGLRYRIPFGEVDDVIGYLRDHATEDGRRIGVMGDDGEKFGAWPTTWDQCWGSRRWVDRFFEAIEANADWLTTVTPSAWLEREPPIGRIYVPTSSYAEMGEWSLPPDESREFSRLLRAANRAGSPEARYLRGGFWRNFQVRYREINDLHKQMLRTSAKVHAMSAVGQPADVPVGERERAVDHLYQGQSNDCYWHGLFGGIYIAHMRLATAEHLIAAEDLADEAARRGPGRTASAVDGGTVLDLDLDGIDEVRLAGPGQVLGIKLDEGAGIGTWDIRAVRHALACVMRRRPEAYHRALIEAPDGGPFAPTHGAVSIHDAVRSKESGLAERIHYDTHERRSGLVRFLAPDTAPGAYGAADETELGDFVDGSFELLELGRRHLLVRRVGSVRSLAGGAQQPVVVDKRITIGGNRRRPRLTVEVGIEHLGRDPIDARFGLEWSLIMLGGGANPAAYHEVDGKRLAHDGSGEAAAQSGVAAGNDTIGLRLESGIEPVADVWWAPIETISNSEGGFERIYQGSGQLISWPIRLQPGERLDARISQVILTTRDRAIEEATAANPPVAGRLRA
jgi:4-alpha-glucanotransferase